MTSKPSYLVSLLTLLLLIGCLSGGYGQQRDIDSLKKLIAGDKKNDTAKIILLNKLAYSYYSVNIDELNITANTALRLSKKIAYPRGEAIAYNDMGLGAMLVNGDPIALEYFENALKIFIKLNDKINQARVLNNMGYYYSNLKKYEQSAYYLNIAIDKISGLNKPYFEAVLLGNAGNNYAGLKDYGKARNCYLKGLAMARKSGAADAMVFSFSTLASLDISQNQFAEAKMFLEKIKSYQKNKDFSTTDRVDMIRLDGEVNAGLKNYSNAKLLFIKGLETADKIGGIDQRIAFNKDLYALDTATGNYRDANIKSEAYHRLNDSISNTNQNQLIALYQTRFEVDKRERENQRLKENAEKYKITISNQHSLQLILLFILLAIIVTLFYFKRINGQINAKNEIINKQNLVLESTNQVKDKIFSVISHDLRSPICQAANLIDLLETGEMAENEMKKITPVVKQSITDTLELLDNLLVWSKNQLQGFQYNPAPFILKGLVEENIRGLASLIENKGLIIMNNIPESVSPTADKEMIKIILRNLISNAIKFTPKGGYIYINSRIEDHQVIVSVEDTGVGIQQKDIDKIFSFTSHSTPGTNNEKGTGLGLKICNDFIVMNKGRIWLESQLNYGSKFFISVPC